MSVPVRSNSWHGKVMTRVDQGRAGQNLLLPVYPLHRASRHLGVGRKIYTLVGADSGVGKSAFTNSCYVLGPYSVWRKMDDVGEAPFDVEWHLRVMERDLETAVGKWICSVLFGNHGILMDVNYLFSRGAKRSYMPDEIYGMVRQTEEFIDRMQEKVHIQVGTTNPTGVFRDMQRVADSNGERLVDRESRKETYTPHDPTKAVFYVIDHIGLLQGETIAGGKTNGGDKMTLDKMGEYLKIARDVYGMSPIVVCQFNREQFNNQRMKAETFDVLPKDFHGSSQMFWDADQVIGIVDPRRMGFTEYKGYSTAKMTNTQNGVSRLRTIRIVKNNIGNDGIDFGLHFIGECGMFLELPRPAEMTDALYTQKAMLPALKQRLVMSEVED